MARNGYFGVRNSHIAICTDEDKLTYKKPVHIPGTVEISMEPSVESGTSHADNDVWLDEQQDNGGSGTMSFFDTEGTPEMRQLIADLVGYEITKDGRTNLKANKKPKPFAFMCEQPGHVLGRRRCLLMCQLSKPSLDMKTTEDSPEITQLDYPFTWKPIVPPGGTSDDRTSGYDSFTGLADYATFFDAVKTEGLLESAANVSQ
ncbi:major tail protein [Olsenella sp. Marseille-P4559]|uniref:major tail protein n=1 Tax=Olsenella sp. Marseille-P4559 TaxID=2364795 RepID=UPI00103083B2|nr:major tail protein [Olsenella sp. Marseille-P4559]